MDPEGTVLKSLEEKYWIETKLSNQLNYWVRGKRTNPHGKLAIAEVRTTSVATLTEVISKSHSSIKRTERVSLAYQCSQVCIFLYAYPSALRLNNYTRYFCTNLCISTYLTDVHRMLLFISLLPKLIMQLVPTSFPPPISSKSY